jgi:AraC family transcriptional regulator of adaptative response/methylated-DNA-[protein]-cysteine methyltransferase
MAGRSAQRNVAFSVDGHAKLELMKTSPPLIEALSRRELEKAFTAKDAGYDGLFYAAVKTTGIFCRPSCPSRPKLEHVEFFPSVKECLDAGYRPCLRCRPLEANGRPPAWVESLQARVEASPDARLGAEDLRALDISPERARRWFKQHYGMSFTAWARGYRLSKAFARLQGGAALDEVTLDSGFESHSGFREAFTRAFREAPGQARQDGQRVVTAVLETPIGMILAGANDEGVCLLEYTDRRHLERTLESMRRQFSCAVLPGEHPHLTQVREELAEYFAGRRREFTVALAPRGTPFQQQVWQELRAIPFGQTIPYDELARRICRPTAQRAVARANGTNRIAILIPCHRVIGKDGSLSGYAGGVWRKRLLLELERS